MVGPEAPAGAANPAVAAVEASLVVAVGEVAAGASLVAEVVAATVVEEVAEVAAGAVLERVAQVVVDLRGDGAPVQPV